MSDTSEPPTPLDDTPDHAPTALDTQFAAGSVGAPSRPDSDLGDRRSGDRTQLMTTRLSAEQGVR